MTADKLQNIVRVLANSSWTRYWLFWDDSDNPTMAVQCIDTEGKPSPIADAESHGLKENPEYVYTTKRTNEDGTKYIRKMI